MITLNSKGRLRQVSFNLQQPAELFCSGKLPGKILKDKTKGFKLYLKGDFEGILFRLVRDEL